MSAYGVAKGRVAALRSLLLLFTSGRVLRPQLLLPSLALYGLIGYGVYHVLNFREASALKMAIAESLRNKRIVMIPTGNANLFNLQTLDLNEILKQLGVTKPK